VQMRIFRAATFSLPFVLFAVVTVHAQESLPAEAASPLSSGVHGFFTWLHNLGAHPVARGSAHQLAIPLPRARPAELAAVAAAPKVEAEPASARPKPLTPFASSKAEAEPAPVAPNKAAEVEPASATPKPAPAASRKVSAPLDINN
jgi:hypothetical protein